MSHSCQYRGEKTGAKTCESCSGHVQVFTWQCLNTLVPEQDCVESKHIEGLATCKTCEHRLMFPKLSREERKRRRAMESKENPEGPLPISLVVTTSGARAALLNECLASVFEHATRPSEVIVVDDNSPDASEQVAKSFPITAYYKVDLGKGRSPGITKRFGIFKASQEYICTLDGDDLVTEGYFAELYAAMVRPDFGVVYPQVRCFGENTETIGMEWDESAFDSYNFICSAGLFRRDALWQMGGWAVERLGCPDDYSTVRKLIQCGWKAQYAPRAVLKYRRHPDSLSMRRMREVGKGNHIWSDSYSHDGLVTTISLISGREWCLTRFLINLLDTKGTDLILVDNSESESVAQQILDWIQIYGREFRSVSYRYDPVKIADYCDSWEWRQNHADLVNDHVAGLWARHTRLIRTPLVYTREDDVVTPPGTLDTLLGRFRGDTAGIGCLYETRSGNGFCAWRNKHLLEAPSEALERVDGISFGALLVRRQILQRYPLRSRGEGELRWYDWQVWDKKDRVYAADIVAEHLMRDGERSSRRQTNLVQA